MTSKIQLLLIGLWLVGGGNKIIAQVDHYCGTDKLHQELLNTDPQYVLNRVNLAEFTKNYKEQNKGKQGTVYTIPIVFHVIHNFGSENITKKKILQGLDIINEDFRKMNSDTNDIVSAFKGIAADCEIQFKMAQLDPDGNCTDGITRTVSSQTMSAGNGVKQLIDWPNNRYLNVWLVNTIASGAGGYAYYPGTTSSTNDGIVLRAGQFGPGNRSLTHEIGHYLNLPHLWGSTNDPEVASNCTADDGVGDTPNTIGNTSCALTGVSCGSLDNVQNYMEYAFCERMFTEGQKTRMRAALNSSASSRNNLWTASNLALTGTDGPDNLCKVSFKADQQVVCVGSTIEFTDESFNGQSDWSWGFPGGTPSSSGDPNPVITYNTPGIYDVSLSVTNGSEVITGAKPAYVVVQSEGDALPLFESFENFDLEESPYWEVVDGDSLVTWEQIEYTGYSGTSSIKMDNYSLNKDGRSDFLISPSFDLSEMTTANLSFQVAFAQKIDTTKDALRVYVSTDCGVSWVLRYVESSSSLATVPSTYSVFTPAAQNQWQEHMVNLDASMLVDGFKFKIEYLNKNGNNLYLDDINLSGNSNTIPMLVAPLNGMVNQMVDFLNLDWNEVGNVDEYEVQLDTQDDFLSPNLGSYTLTYLGIGNNGGDTQFLLSDLDEGATYYWRARTITNSVNSGWSAIWNFTTLTNAIGISESLIKSLDISLYPNPTSGITIVQFQLLAAAQVEISVVDLMGREVHSVYTGILPRGNQAQKIPKVNTPGIYFVKINVGSSFYVKKMIVKS